MSIQNSTWCHEAERSLWAQCVHENACLSHSWVVPYLKRIQIIPGQSPGHHLPQDDPKCVHISRLAVVMLRDHLHCPHDSQHVLTANAWVSVSPICMQEPYRTASFVKTLCRSGLFMPESANRSSMKNNTGKTDDARQKRMILEMPPLGPKVTLSHQSTLQGMSFTIVSSWSIKLFCSCNR